MVFPVLFTVVVLICFFIVITAVIGLFYCIGCLSETVDDYRQFSKWYRSSSQSQESEPPTRV